MRKITLGVICVTVLMGGAVLVVSRSDAAPPSKWKAVILPSANLSGDPARYQSALGGDVYDDAESNVDVYATMGSMATGPYWTVFKTVVLYPEKINIFDVYSTSFQRDGRSGMVYDGYPPTGATPMFEFLNGTHPYDERYRVNIAFCGPYVTSRAEADWENKPVGWEIRGRIQIDIMTDGFFSGDCHVCAVYNYHDIVLHSHDAWLKKESPTTYLISLNTGFNNPVCDIGPAPWMQNVRSDFILNRYCFCETRVVKKGAYEVNTNAYPELGAAPMAFQIRYVKY